MAQAVPDVSVEPHQRGVRATVLGQAPAGPIHYLTQDVTASTLVESSRLTKPAGRRAVIQNP